MDKSFMSDEMYRVECSIKAELTKATVALREQFRQQLVLERQDRQVSVAELRRDMEAQHAALDWDRGSDAEAPPVGTMAAAPAMLQSLTISRVSQKVEKLREEVFAGLAQLRSDFEEQMRLAIRSEDFSKEGDGSIATVQVISAQQDALQKLHSHFVGLKETVEQLRSDVALHSNSHSDLTVQKAQVESLRQEVSKLLSQNTSTSVAKEADTVANALMADRLASVEADVRKFGVRASRMEEVANLAQAVVTLTQQSQQPIVQELVAFRNFMRTTDARLNNSEKRLVSLDNTPRSLVNLDNSQRKTDKIRTELEGMDSTCTISVRGNEFASSDTTKDGSEAAMKDIKDVYLSVKFDEDFGPATDKLKGLDGKVQLESSLPEGSEEQVSTQGPERLMSDLRKTLSGLVTKIQSFQSESKVDTRSRSPVKPASEATTCGKQQSMKSPTQKSKLLFSRDRTASPERPADPLSVSTGSSIVERDSNSSDFITRRGGSATLKKNPEVNTASADVPWQVSTSLSSPPPSVRVKSHVQGMVYVYENAASQIYTGTSPRSTLARRPASHVLAQGLSPRVTAVRSAGNLHQPQQSSSPAFRQSGSAHNSSTSPPAAMRQRNPLSAPSHAWSSTHQRGRPQNPPDAATHDI